MSVEAFNVAQDNVDDRRSGFFTCKWVIGFICSLIAGILHVGRCFRHTFLSLIYIFLLFFIVVTPFVDIVVLSFNSATAILIQVFMAIFFLNEVFICKYDLTALFLIILGSSCLILTANFSQ